MCPALLWAIFLLPASIVMAQDCRSLQGTWTNELGSLLVIDSVRHGRIYGSYGSSTAVDGDIFSLIGWTNHAKDTAVQATVVNFSVHWGEYGSITSWTGYCREDSTGSYIKTLWHLARPRVEYEWEHVISNSSTFRPWGQ